MTDHRAAYKAHAQHILDTYGITPDQINIKVRNHLGAEFGWDRDYTPEQYVLGIELLREELEYEDSLDPTDLETAYDFAARVEREAGNVENAKLAAENSNASVCLDCSGTGTYYAGGAVVNGRFTGKTGPCYRCQGKGYQTDDDRKRNEYYDLHVRTIRLD